MNARILELIKTPENFQPEDLQIFEKEIKNYPYIQNIRALYLYGINKFRIDDYQTELAKTAAYTTDKKILYHFINRNSTTEIIEELPVVSNIEVSNPEILSANYHKEEIKSESIIDEKSSVENENFSENLILKEENPSLENDISNEVVNDFDSKNLNKEEIEIENETSENTVSEVFENKEITSPNEAKFVEVPENFTPEKIINENKIKSEESEIEKSSELSFHGTADFLPEVKIDIKPSESALTELPKQNTNRHNDEMQRLIAEVEAKMKANKKPNVAEEEKHGNFDINFAETHDFVFPKSEEKIDEKTPEITKEEQKIIEKEEISEDISLKKQEEIIEETKISEPNSGWKPMSVFSNLPDALLEKKEEKSPKIEAKEDEIVEKPQIIEKIEKNQSEEIPVINASFFSPEVSKIETEIEEPNITEEPKISESESNVPKFINTWQSWLKLERKPEPEVKTSENQTENQTISEEIKVVEIEVKNELPKEEIKTKAIESFIENEPKISKLKEDSEFVVKEKGDNISHLMTETLAKLYTEQKLYTKAIKAYETLSQKHPEKADYFGEKIQEIKELRQNQK